MNCAGSLQAGDAECGIDVVTQADEWRRRMLERGDAVPHFDVRTVGGDVFSYSTIWQQKNLVLITLAADASDSGYVSELSCLSSEFNNRDCVCVITRDRVPGLPASGALVADRWGEIVFVVAASDIADLPTPAQLLEWVEYVEMRCPECEGEAN